MQNLIFSFRPRKKKPVLRAERFQKAVGQSAQFFFLYFFAKITRKNHGFFLARFGRKFFVQKTADFNFFYFKKNSTNGKKVDDRARRTGFFSWS